VTGLSIAQIEAWRAGDVREVFHAARGIAEANQLASDGLATLPAFETWGGVAADAARDSNAQIRRDLDVFGREALAVARAADRAADGIEKVQADLRALRDEAHSLHMTIDPMTSRIVPDGTANLLPMEALIAEQQLQPKLDLILAEANDVDHELANAIDMADGDAPIPADSGPAVGHEGLTPTQLASDANQVALREERLRAQAEVDRLQPRFDELARQAYVTGDHSSQLWDQLNDMGPRLADARKRVGELDAVTDAMSKAPETYLAMLDVPKEFGKPVHAAVAVGNPDTAKNVSVTVPGVGSTTRTSLPDMVQEARNLQIEGLRQMANANVPMPDRSMATIAWMGYDPPANALNTQSARDVWATMNDDLASQGATNLSKFLQTVDANNPGAHVTLLGHSYGSLTSSLALQQLNAQGVHGVDDVVFYGSPGLEAGSATDLGLGKGHAFVMRADEDLVTNVFGAPLSAAHGWGLNPYDGQFPELSSSAGTSPLDNLAREAAHSHADYPRMADNDRLRMSGYNLAVIAAGLDPREVAVFAQPPLPIR